jgi:hypothetical protein
MGSKKLRGGPERIVGLYFGVPADVLDSPAFQGASHQARSLLFELMRQHNGGNNGHLHLSAAWLRNRGWKASDVVRRARDNLLDRRLIVLTKKGGRNIGPDRFALAWHDITNLAGLEILRSDYRKGQYRTAGPQGPSRGSNRKPPKRASDAVIQPSPALAHSAHGPEPALIDSAKSGIQVETPALAVSDDVIIAIPQGARAVKIRGKTIKRNQLASLSQPLMPSPLK